MIKDSYKFEVYINHINKQIQGMMFIKRLI